MTILISGGTGFVGAATLAHLAAEGREVVVLAAHPAEPGWLPAGAEVVIGDIGDGEGLRSLMAGRRVSKVIHAAAITAGPDMERLHPERVIAVNVAGTAAIMRAAAEAGVSRVVIASSASVYPLAKANGGRFRADQDAPAPATLYGLTKKMAEDVATRLGAVYRIDTPILRIAGVYGPYERDTGVREILSAQAQVVADARAGRPTRLSRPGFGGWLYSRDAAAGLAALLEAPLDAAAPIYDLGGPEVFSLDAFCAALAPAFTGWSHAIDPDAPTVRFQIPVDKPASDFERLSQATGLAPRFGMAAAVADYLSWLERHPSALRV
ncbi:NAD-dependent epimerase/dehydratase family protein [Phreatobacter sp.]|uniref:NAD-dependent epimerase/dehydratase family protein n=1 Tax=Phreatobacter sp. TaxID=1966341 RepID=UPI003F6ED703